MKQLSVLVNELTGGKSREANTTQIARRYGIGKIGGAYVCTPAQEAEIIKKWKSKHRVDKKEVKETYNARLIDILRTISGEFDVRTKYDVVKIARDFNCVKLRNTWLCDYDTETELLNELKMEEYAFAQTKVQGDNTLAYKYIDMYLEGKIDENAFLTGLDICKEMK